MKQVKEIYKEDFSLKKHRQNTKITIFLTIYEDNNLTINSNNTNIIKDKCDK